MSTSSLIFKIKCMFVSCTNTKKYIFIKVVKIEKTNVRSMNGTQIISSLVKIKYPAFTPVNQI